jgi:hypothetical protein
MSDLAMLAGKAVFGVAGLAAGWQLARQARRDGGFPVHRWASTVIFVGGIGLVGFALAPLVAVRSAALAGALMVAFDAFERAALFGLGVFVWRVFGQGRTSRSLVLGAIGAALLLDWIQVLAAQRWPEPAPGTASTVVSQLAFSLPLAWSSVEAGLEYRRARRRLRLGLADRATLARFAMWSGGCGALAAVCVAAAVAAAAPGGAVQAATEWLRAVLYAGIAVLVWLGFFPPSAFRRRLAEPARPAPAA